MNYKITYTKGNKLVCKFAIIFLSNLIYLNQFKLILTNFNQFEIINQFESYKSNFENSFCL